VDDRAHCGEHAGCERLPTERIVAYRQQLAGTAEEHFLMRDEPG
jgi:hypothetical protein